MDSPGFSRVRLRCIVTDHVINFEPKRKDRMYVTAFHTGSDSWSETIPRKLFWLQFTVLLPGLLLYTWMDVSMPMRVQLPCWIMIAYVQIIAGIFAFVQTPVKTGHAAIRDEINTLRHSETCHHIADDVLKSFSHEHVVVWYKFHRNLYRIFQFTIGQNSFK